MTRKRFVVATKNKNILKVYKNSSYKINNIFDVNLFDLIRFENKDKSISSDWFEITSVTKNFQELKTLIKFRKYIY